MAVDLNEQAPEGSVWVCSACGKHGNGVWLGKNFEKIRIDECQELK